MNRYNVNVLADAKQEYSKQLVNVLYPEIYIGIKSIYDSAYKHCKETHDKNVLKKFQFLLSKIPKWNQDKIDQEFKRIAANTECDWIDDLITAVFVSHTKVLSSIKLKNNTKSIPLNVPVGTYFVHKCYIEVARNFWKKAWLLHTDISTIDLQRNMVDSENLIKDSIIETVRKLLPVKFILQEYLGQDYEDEEIHDEVEQSMTKSAKSNLRKLVKYEIEQTLSKKSEDDNDDNFSRFEINDNHSDGPVKSNQNTQTSRESPANHDIVSYDEEGDVVSVIDDSHVNNNDSDKCVNLEYEGIVEKNDEPVPTESTEKSLTEHKDTSDESPIEDDNDNDNIKLKYESDVDEVSKIDAEEETKVVVNDHSDEVAEDKVVEDKVVEDKVVDAVTVQKEDTVVDELSKNEKHISLEKTDTNDTSGTSNPIVKDEPKSQEGGSPEITKELENISTIEEQNNNDTTSVKSSIDIAKETLRKLVKELGPELIQNELASTDNNVKLITDTNINKKPEKASNILVTKVIDNDSNDNEIEQNNISKNKDEGDQTEIRNKPEDNSKQDLEQTEVTNSKDNLQKEEGLEANVERINLDDIDNDSTANRQINTQPEEEFINQTQAEEPIEEPIEENDETLSKIQKDILNETKSNDFSFFEDAVQFAKM